MAQGHDTLAMPGHASGPGARRATDPAIRWSRLGLVVYGVDAGIVTTAVGDWVSSGWSGASRLVIWISVTAALAIGAAWVAEPAVTLLARCLQERRGRRSAVSR